MSRSIDLQRSKLPELVDNLTFDSWANESHELALAFAYKDGSSLLKGAHKDHDHDDGPLAIPPFPEGYRDGARLRAQRRVALAGYRLADKLTPIFPQNK